MLSIPASMRATLQSASRSTQLHFPCSTGLKGSEFPSERHGQSQSQQPACHTPTRPDLTDRPSHPPPYRTILKRTRIPKKVQIKLRTSPHIASHRIIIQHLHNSTICDQSINQFSDSLYRNCIQLCLPGLAKSPFLSQPAYHAVYSTANRTYKYCSSRVNTASTSRTKRRVLCFRQPVTATTSVETEGRKFGEIEKVITWVLGLEGALAQMHRLSHYVLAEPHATSMRASPKLKSRS